MVLDSEINHIPACSVRTPRMLHICMYLMSRGINIAKDLLDFELLWILITKIVSPSSLSFEVRWSFDRVLELV